MKRQHFLLLPLTLALTQVWAADEPVEQDSALAPVVVTGTQQQKANTVKFNPKATIQPMPAGDGADLLQSVPNMSIIRAIRCSAAWAVRACPSMRTTSLFTAAAVCVWTRRPRTSIPTVLTK